MIKWEANKKYINAIDSQPTTEMLDVMLVINYWKRKMDSGRLPFNWTPKEIIHYFEIGSMEGFKYND